MPGLRRPDLAPGPHRDLVEALHHLHHTAGWPSLRRLAGEAACSHTTVSEVFSSTRLPAWRLLEQLVEAMSGDTDHFRALWLAATGQGGDGGSQAVPAIAGRRVELTAVRRHLQDGAGLLVVAGDAGIGKTRLVETAAALAADHTFLARGSCLPLSTQVPLLPVADLLGTVHAHDGGRWLADALSGCAPYVAASIARVLPELADVATVEDPDDDWSRQRLFAAVGAALAALAALRPLGLVIEDLHWADTTTLDLLEHLVAHGTRTPVVGTRREDDRDTSPMLTAWWDRIRRTPAVTVVELGALTRDETRHQLELILPHPVDDAVVDRIHGRSLGQPLFTEQLAQARAGSAELPGLLADILDHRLHGLTPPAWAVARTLGVADRSLPHDVLAAVVALDGDLLVRALHELRGRHLLAEAASGDVGLSHPLLAEAVRRRLVPGEAADVHRGLAGSLASSPAPAAAEVATHWQGAGDAAEELHWRIAAARAAERRFAAAQAATHWLRALDLWPADHSPAGTPPVSLLSAHLAAMDALESSAQNDRASVVVAKALGLAPTLTDSELADLYRRAADYMADFDEDAALALVDRAIQLHGRADVSERLLGALRLRSAILGDLGRVDEALAAARRAVTVNEQLAEPALMRSSLMNLAWHEAVAGSLEDARRHAAEAARVAARVGTAESDPMRELGLAMRHTDILLICGADVQEVEDAARTALEAVTEWRIDNIESATTLANVSEARRRAGQVTLAGELVDPWTDGPLQPHRWALHIERAKLDMLRGRTAEAIARFDELATLERPSLWDRAEVARCVARNQLWLRQPRRALDLLLPVIEEAADTDALASMGPLLVLAASAAGDLVEQLSPPAATACARELVDRLAAARSRVSSDPLATWRRGALVASWAAELARVEGTATVAGWLDAATAWDELGRPHRSAYCRWRAAQVALREGRATLAGRLLRRAGRDAREHRPLLAWIRATGGG